MKVDTSESINNSLIAITMQLSSSIVHFPDASQTAVVLPSRPSSHQIVDLCPLSPLPKRLSLQKMSLNKETDHVISLKTKITSKQAL